VVSLAVGDLTTSPSRFSHRRVQVLLGGETTTNPQRRTTLKKKATDLKKLSLSRETLTALRHDGRLEGLLGGVIFSHPPVYTCPECAPKC
jgi:hypothetical protein